MRSTVLATLIGFGLTGHQSLADEVCFKREFPADFALEGELTYDVSDDHIRFSLDLERLQLGSEVLAIDLVYGVSRSVPKFLSALEYDELPYKLRAPISLTASGTEVHATFSLRRHFDDLAVMVLLAYPANGKVPDCGTRYFVNVSSRGLAPNGGELPL